jgi:RNA polymerase sigma-54 factor
MVPEHILGKAVLKMSLQELHEFVHAELAENPALVIEEDATCPVCGSVMMEGICSSCGSRAFTDEEAEQRETDEWVREENWTAPAPDDELEPFAFVATPCSLSDHLREQIRTNFPEESVAVAEFLVDSLDEDGYLREPMFDLASQFGMSVPQMEEVLFRVQRLDPPGIAARTLQECLLVQVEQIEADSDEKERARVIVSEHWELLSKIKVDEIAKKMAIPKADVESALRFVRERLNPYPASQFRDPWHSLAPRRDARFAPDVVVRDSEVGLVAEVVDPIAGKIGMDEIYSSLYAEMSQKKNGHSEKDREQIKESVQNARSLIEALEFRRSSLRRVAEHLIDCQFEFFKQGPEHLKPINRKQISQQIGLHESTVCRATDGKMIQLPSGEVIPFEVLFDAALPVKELVRRYATERMNGKPLSDNEIAEKLQTHGVQIARRTVAKYRDQLRLLSAYYRLG